MRIRNCLFPCTSLNPFIQVYVSNEYIINGPATLMGVLIPLFRSMFQTQETDTEIIILIPSLNPFIQVYVSNKKIKEKKGKSWIRVLIPLFRSMFQTKLEKFGKKAIFQVLIPLFRSMFQTLPHFCPHHKGPCGGVCAYLPHFSPNRVEILDIYFFDSHLNPYFITNYRFAHTYPDFGPFLHFPEVRANCQKTRQKLTPDGLHYSTL